MRVGIYSRDSVPGAQDFSDGLAAVGHEGVLRSAPDWGEGCMEPFDAVALFGLHGKGRAIFRAYGRAGIPVVLIDYGYVRRVNHVHDWKTGYWQVSVGGLNRPPAFACPADRFEALDVQITERGGSARGYVLLCVQEPGDASHGMDKQALQAWCDEQAARYPGLVVRPHPLAPDLDYGLPRCAAESLSDALAGARLVVTANSNTGHDALLAGVPVVGTLAAAWQELAGEELPSLERRTEYFRRLAYGQWTWAEFRQGIAQRFLIDHLLPGVGFAQEDVAPAEAPRRRGRPPKAAA